MASAESSTLIGRRYRTIRLIGRGGSGTVYEVEHVHTGQRLAMKVLDIGPHADLVRFNREARAMSRLQHENVVRITDADFASELGDLPFLVMELLEGSDLEKACGSGPVPVPQAIDWLRQTARGLEAVHAADMVHRDLKPQNLFLTRGEDARHVVKILDFGISKLAIAGETITVTDQFLGTPSYMAPEQVESFGPPVTRQADLYALGLVAFRLLVGRVYWRPGTLSQLLTQILIEPMETPSARGAAFGSAFDSWFSRACNRDVGLRFGSAREQVEALVEALDPRPMGPLESVAKTTPSSGFHVPTCMLPGRTRRRSLSKVGLACGIGLVGVTLAAAAVRTVRVSRVSGSMGSPSFATARLPAPPPPTSDRSDINPPPVDGPRSPPSDVIQGARSGPRSSPLVDDWDAQARSDSRSPDGVLIKAPPRSVGASSSSPIRSGRPATRDPLEGQF